jgi:quercetin dioxygenase-like cupin family protein
MNGRFIRVDDLVRETFDWGEIGWVSRPSFTGSADLCVMDVTFYPGGGHPFHRHPDQEEIIWVHEGQVEQWLEKDKRMLGPGDAIYIPRDVVHASFNVGNEPAKASVALAPAAGEDGYSVIDVFEQEPWASLKAGFRS